MPHVNRYLYGTVFITGACVLVLEIAAVRVLSPHYGSSLYVFSSVLSVILAALSAGYWYGGKRADEQKSIDELYWLIAISGVVALMLLFAAQLLLPNASMFFSIKTGPLIYSAILFFAPAFLLGIVSPYIIKLQSLHTPTEHIGSVVGRTFFFGTVGSIAGSIATGFWLIPLLGVYKTILLVGITLIAVGILVPFLLQRPLRMRYVLGVVFVAAAIVYAINLYEQFFKDQYVYRADGLYSSITIRDDVINDRPVRFMHRDRNNSSAMYKDSDSLVFLYTQTAFLYEQLLPETENFLLIGGGAYTIPRALVAHDTDMHVDVVEIEPRLFSLAQTYFDLTDTTRISNYAMDARVFLRNTDAVYDTIYQDAFSTDEAVPFHLTTQEFYRELKTHLTEDGVLIINFIGKPKTTRPSLVGSFTKTLTSVFPNTKAFPVFAHESSKLQNIIFVSRNNDEPIDIGDFAVTDIYGTKTVLSEHELSLDAYQLDREYLFTDDHAPVEQLAAKDH